MNITPRNNVICAYVYTYTGCLILMKYHENETIEKIFQIKLYDLKRDK